MTEHQRFIQKVAQNETTEIRRGSCFPGTHELKDVVRIVLKVKGTEQEWPNQGAFWLLFGEWCGGGCRLECSLDEDGGRADEERWRDPNWT